MYSKTFATVDAVWRPVRFTLCVGDLRKLGDRYLFDNWVFTLVSFPVTDR